MNTALRLAAIGLLVAGMGLPPDAVLAQDGPPGLTAPVVFPPFDPDAPACSAPPGLMRTLAFVQENDRDFLEGVNHGLSLAAADRGLEYRRLLADSDAPKAAAEIRDLVEAKVGAMVATSSDPAVVSKDIQEAIWTGAYVGTVVPPPATLLLNAPQYQTGKVLADAAIGYIKGKLGGNAKVVLLTQDTMQYLAPRFQAMRDELSQLPGVTIVADIAPNPVTEQGGYDTMTTVLQAIPDIDMVLGADAVVLGALRALRDAKKDRPDQFLGGIDGEPQAITEIKSGNSPYKASIALNSPVFGYAMGQYGADWLDGKSVPQAMDILPIALTIDNLAAYEADLHNPAAAFSDPARRAYYLRMYGNICYDTRDQYVNFPWSSENH
jgi:ribose transport system substrate-binding protein